MTEPGEVNGTGEADQESCKAAPSWQLCASRARRRWADTLLMNRSLGWNPISLRGGSPLNLSPPL